MIHRWVHASGFLLCAALFAHAQGEFTFNIGSVAVPPATLVNFDDVWQYHLGTNAPQADWKTNLNDAAMDATWAAGPGGFGYEDGDDNTLLLVMSNRCSTLYIRKVFQLPPGTDPARTLRLTMDWDDAFIAWLDGTEIARSPNAPSGEPPHTALSNPPNHEASRGSGGSPPTTYDLGPVGARLSPGTHVLAVMGLNGALNSSDFSLIADLTLSGTSGGAAADGLFALVKTNQIMLFGSNTLANAARVTINGFPANFDPVAGTWNRLEAFQPGMNRLFIASLDAEGNILNGISKDIVSEVDSITAGGNISANTTWSGIVRVTNDIVVNTGATLAINPGTVVLLGAAGSLRATNNGTVNVAGAPEQSVFFLPADANTPWRDLSANGANSHLLLRHAEVVAGQVRAANGGATLIEDSVMRDLATTTRQFVEGVKGADLTMRRSYFARFSELDSADTPVLVEDCLMEQFLVDGIDIKTTLNLPLIVRRTTFRYADPNNSNADAIDFGPGAGFVERCLIHHFPDKGVSIGGASGTIVRESLIYRCGIGVSAYASTNLLIQDTTLAACTNGILFRNNPTAAVGIASNVIVWGNLTNVAILNTSSLNISHSDIEGTNYPGAGNISADPLFGPEFGIPASSPALGMGAKFPLGGIPSAPFNLAAIVNGNGPLILTWREDADNETTFAIERSTNGVNWAPLAAIGPNQTSFIDATADFDVSYFYRVRAENASGVSPWSNPASGIRQQPLILVGGTLTQNTIWSPAMGRFVVISNLIVPTNITLTILAGADVRLTNAVSIRATTGGTIDVNGIAEQPVIFSRTGTSNWGELAADGPNASLTLRYVETEGGTVKFRNGATGLMEDCYVHHYQNPGSSIAGSTGAQSVNVRRCHFAYYHETLFQNGLIVIEDSLFEYASNASSDALDFDGALPGSTIRRCTFRHGQNSNTDAIDLGSGSLNVVVENCLMYDFPFDKGVSIGEASFGIIVRNCLMYGCDSGIAVKDSCTATVNNCTIVNNDFGYKNFNKANPAAPTGGGHIIDGWNNILWNNITNVSLLNGSTMTNDHSDLGTNWPGAGNINLDPLFVNAGSRDYRLSTLSACRGTGRNGTDMGAQYPVGAPMAPSHPAVQAIERTDYGNWLAFWADSERSYTVQYSPAITGPWTKLEDISNPPRPALVRVFDTVPAQANPQNRFYRLVSPAQP